MAQAPAPKPSFIPRGYIALTTAIEKFGEVTAPNKMQEISEYVPVASDKMIERFGNGKKSGEFSFLEALGVALASFGDGYIALSQINRKMAEIAGEFRHELFDGAVKSYIRTSNGRIVPVPTNVWGFDIAATSLSAGRIGWVSDPNGTKVPYEGECLIWEAELRDFLNAISKTIDHEPNKLKEGPKLTAKLEGIVSELMKQLAKSPVRITRKEARRIIEEKLGHPIGTRIFLRAWKQHAPKEWQKAGTPPKSKRP